MLVTLMDKAQSRQAPQPSEEAMQAQALRTFQGLYLAPSCRIHGVPVTRGAGSHAGAGQKGKLLAKQDTLRSASPYNVPGSLLCTVMQIRDVSAPGDNGRRQEAQTAAELGDLELRFTYHQFQGGHSAPSCRYLVSQNPEVEAKILAELDDLELSITPQRPRPRRMTYADLNRLTYLQATIKVPSLPSSSLHSANSIAARGGGVCCAGSPRHTKQP